MMRAITYPVVIRAGNESGYVATVPALPGCVTQATTRRGAIRNAREAIEVYIESLLEDGRPVPLQHGTELIDSEVSAR